MQICSPSSYYHLLFWIVNLKIKFIKIHWFYVTILPYHACTIWPQEEAMIKVAFVVNGKPDLRPVPRQQSLKSLIQVIFVPYRTVLYPPCPHKNPDPPALNRSGVQSRILGVSRRICFELMILDLFFLSIWYLNLYIGFYPCSSLRIFCLISFQIFLPTHC